MCLNLHLTLEMEITFKIGWPYSDPGLYIARANYLTILSWHLVWLHIRLGLPVTVGLLKIYISCIVEFMPCIQFVMTDFFLVDLLVGLFCFYLIKLIPITISRTRSQKHRNEVVHSS